MENINLFINAIGTSSFDAPLLKNSTCTVGTMEEVTWRLKVVPELCNSLGTMHGGAIAAGIDLFTSAALCPHRRGILARPHHLIIRGILGTPRRFSKLECDVFAACSGGLLRPIQV